MTPKENQLQSVSTYTFLVATIIMGLSGWILKDVLNAPYGTYEMIRLTFPAEVLMATILTIVVWKFFGFKQIGFSKPKLVGLFWFGPIVLLLVLNIVLFFMGIDSSSISVIVQKQLLNILMVTILVGFNEELLFRGILLEGLLVKYTKAKSILLSAVLFSLFHSVNYFSGEPLISVLSQLVMAFIAGFFLACIRIKMNSIWPLMIWHALWDFSVFSATMMELPTNPILLLSPIFQLILGIFILRSIQKKDIQKTLTSSK